MRDADAGSTIQRKVSPGPGSAYGRTYGEHDSIFRMARRPDHKKAEVLTEDDLTQLRHNLAHLSVGAVRDFYDQAYRDCRLIYHRLPSPKQMQVLVQAWKQLWKWR
jgi:hypothetical protein